MARKQWNPDPAPFGNAGGFDRVSLDVKRTIAERMGATVTVGRFADDIQAEQERQRENREPDDERDARDNARRGPYAAITVSLDGLSISGDTRDGNCHTSGYRSSYWLGRMDEQTVVYDLRSMPTDAAISFAVRGPMLGPELPPNTVDGFAVELPDGTSVSPLDDPTMRTVADDYLRTVGASVDKVLGT